MITLGIDEDAKHLRVWVSVPVGYICNQNFSPGRLGSWRGRLEDDD